MTTLSDMFTFEQEAIIIIIIGLIIIINGFV